MITGWGNIIAKTGLSRNTLKRLVAEEAFPVQYVGDRPVTTLAQIEEWLRARLVDVRAKRPN